MNHLNNLMIIILTFDILIDIKFTINLLRDIILYIILCMIIISIFYNDYLIFNKWYEL